MNKSAPLTFALTFLFSTMCLYANPMIPQSGIWRAWLVSPGGELPFFIELQQQGQQWHGWIINGPERIAIPHVQMNDGQLTLNIDYYDSTIKAKLSGDADRLDGEWKKKGVGDSWNGLPFHATFGEAPRFKPHKTSVPQILSIDGRWMVQFKQSEEPAIGLFRSHSDGTVTGTFMTTTGDYRFLAGDFDGLHLRLSCFDGAHAFLFKAEIQSDDRLTGDFWSRDSWHETWLARRDPHAKLPDAFKQTRWMQTVSLGDLQYPDTQGKIHSLADPDFSGKARLIVVFGTWCPNCNDSSEYLVELHKRYSEQGLSILGLAFELTGDFHRDARQVKKYVTKHGIEYPILIAGESNKTQATEAFPLLDRIRSYPTTIFMNGEGKVVAVHTGFTGPATGNDYHQLRAKFEFIIESMLTD